MKTCVYVNVKNELRIAEFIKYYINLGIDYFIIMDDDSIEDVNITLINNNIDTHIYNVLYTNKRRFLYGVYNSKDHWDNELLPILHKNNIDYVLHVDADEFLYLNKFKNIHELINYYSPFDSLVINWLLFGSNNLSINETDSIIYSFNKSDNKLNPYVKSLTKVSSINTNTNEGFCPNPHVLNINSNGITKNILNKCIPKNYNKLTENLPIVEYNKVPIYIAHYIIQDTTTYIHRKVYMPVFLQTAQNYIIPNDTMDLIKQNETLLVNLLNKPFNENDDFEKNEDINKINCLTKLPKKIIHFLHYHFNRENKNIIVNNDIITYYNMSRDTCSNNS
jgi:hypothetical protein